MSIVGLGTDIASVSRIDELVSRHGDRFLMRCFRPSEIEYAATRGLGQSASLAARWAAKEAFLKALGRSVGHIPYGDIEIVRSEDGPVSLKLHGRAREALEHFGDFECLLTMSHEKNYATATVIIQLCL